MSEVQAIQTKSELERKVGELKQKLGANAGDAETKKGARRLLRLAASPGCAIFELYRAYAKDLDVEKDLRALMPAVRGHDLARHDLEGIRRFLLRRYSWSFAKEVSKELVKEHGESRLRLYKDLSYPRIGLAVLIGYGALLGAGPLFDDWLLRISRCGWAFWLLLAVLLGLAFVMVRFNVRYWVGGERGTVRRTLGAFGAGLMWAALVTGIAWLLSIPAGLREQFEWKHASLSGAVALAFALLGQFFFASDRSIAEPL